MIYNNKVFLEELKLKLSELESNLNKIFKNKSHSFYQKRLAHLLRDVRLIKLRFEKEIKDIPKKLKNGALENIVNLLDKLINKQSVDSKKDISYLINQIQLKIQEIEVLFEEHNPYLERVYDLGSHFDFHLDIKEILNRAKNNIFIVDSWIDGDLLEVYLKKINPQIHIRILTNSNNGKSTFLKIGNIFKSQNKNIEARESPNIHDRAIFCDNQEVWVMGQSIKDAAKNKPTYLVKLKDNKKLNSIYQKIWLSSTKVI